MQSRLRKACLMVPVALAGCGTAYTTLELVLELNRRSLCATSGCEIIGRYTRYGEIPVLLMGLLLFLSLTFLTGLRAAQENGTLIAPFSWLPPRLAAGMLDTLFCVSLSAEGYLLGVQLFQAQALCRFCLGVLIMIVLSAVAYTAVFRRPAVLNGALGFAGLLLLSFLVLPPQAAVDLKRIARETIVSGEALRDCYLFYGQDCAHCQRVIDYCRQQASSNCQVRLCPVDECANLLEALNIRDVPALLVDEGPRKQILIGDAPIITYLQNRVQDGTSGSGGADFWSAPSPERPPAGTRNACPAGRPCG